MLSGLRRRAAGALLAVLAVLAVVGVAPAARAAPAAADDSVRSAEMWVLNDLNVRPAWTSPRVTASRSR